MALKDKVVKIAYELKDRFSGRVGQVTSSIRSVGTQSDATTAKIVTNNAASGSSFDKIVAGASRARVAILAVITGTVALVAGVGKATRAAAIQERAETKLATSLRNLTGATDEQVQALKDQAAAIQLVTGYGDEQILSAQAQLATFQLTSEQILQLTPLLVDMAESARKAGDDSGDLESTALALGKAFSSGIGSLSRYGVALTDAQKEAFKLADQQGKVDVVTAALTDNFGGLAEAVGKTYDGKIRGADSASGDFLETLGRLFTKNKSFIKLQELIIDAWNKMAKGIEGSSAEIGVVIGGLVRVLVAAGNTIRFAFNAIQAGVKSVAALVVLNAAVITRALAAITFGDVSREFKRTSDELFKYSRELKEGIIEDAKDMEESIVGFESAFDKNFGKATKAAKNAADGISEASDKTQDALKAETEAAEKAAEAQKARADELKKAVEQSKKALEDELQSAKDVSDEFQQLINDVQSGPQKAAEDLTVIDFAEGLTNAQQALNANDFDGAIEGARSTADLLRQMKQAGVESDLVLTGLAQKLKRLADQAAANKAIAAQNAVKVTQDQLQSEADNKEVTQKLVLDTTEARQQLDELVQQASAPIIKKIHISADGASFSDRPISADEAIRQEARKKGSR